MRDAQFRKDEGGPQVDVEGVVELVDGDVGDVGDALAVAGVGDEDVRAVLAVPTVNEGEEPVDVVG